MVANSVNEQDNKDGQYTGTLFMIASGGHIGIILNYDAKYQRYYCYNVTQDHWFEHSDITINGCFYHKWWEIL